MQEKIPNTVATTRVNRKPLRWVTRVLKLAMLSVFLLVLAIALYAAVRFLPNQAVTYDNMEDHFKYGSTGGDQVTGIPFWIWQAMPLVCANTLQDIVGDRLAPDYLDRVTTYNTDSNEPARRRALSREGYKAIGFLYESDENGQELDLPVGMSKRRVLGLDRTYINCATCHTSTVRKSPDDTAEVVVGMPANLFSLYDFEEFIFQCGKDGNPTRIPQIDFVSEIQSLGGDLGLIDRYLVYPFAILTLRNIVQVLENVGGFSARQPNWGPGRNDTFTNNKVFSFGYDWRKQMPDWNKTGEVDPEGIGIVDWPSTWLQGLRKTRSDGKPMQLHWDGNNTRVEERNLNASMATSALPPAIDHESIECIEQWLETLEPPAYIFDIDRDLAKQGEPIYGEYCASCHGLSGRNFEGKYVGFVTPIDEVKTDRYRLDNYTEELALNMAATFAEKERQQQSHDCPGGTTYEPPIQQEIVINDNMSKAEQRVVAMRAEENTYRYKYYRKTNGYANMPLDGVWLRAPYLHNGSVPTLKDLLEPTYNRPTTFYRGNDVYDPINVGFLSTESHSKDGKPFFEFNTTYPGNGNQGHEGREYGTFLSQDKKQALLEYLKTF
ncbi:MAG: di-heme-cytochrome C peroxidase [Gammaproteobacteria bacterium]|nr:di-heme-cytochrome C peroxidase [Gammaproteobacteria bacterium]